MSCFTSELEITARLQIESRTRRLQLADTRRTFFDEYLDRLSASQMLRRGACVAAMQLGRISGAKRRGDSALSIRRRAVEQRPLGQHHHVSFGRCPERRVEPCNAASDNEKACSDALCHGVKSIGIQQR